jgi:hypothetical protein
MIVSIAGGGIPVKPFAPPVRSRHSTAHAE